MINEYLKKVRVIGDPVLHHAGVVFPENATQAEWNELYRQIDVAKEIVIATGGGGIAANQCVEAGDTPYQLAIVGVFNNNPLYVANLAKRYPNVKFPNAMIMINPKIISCSEQKVNFSHGCLSVPGCMRGEIASPQEIIVEYKTFEKNKLIPAKKMAKDMEAIVLWHELNHILSGKTYMDCGLDVLSSSDQQKVSILLKDYLENKTTVNFAKEGEFYQIIYIENGKSILNEHALKEWLKSGTADFETISGLLKQIEEIERKK